MDWQEQAIVLGAKKHGETSAIVDVLTRDHGRHAGLVRGGRSKRMRPILQQGNLVQATWRARLEEQLGNFTFEPISLGAAMAMDDPFRLAGLTSLTAMCGLLPDRDPQPQVYEAALLVLENLDHEDIWPALLVRWEAGLLDALGFGLDLSQCAATGATENLAYVSPKSGRAISLEAGEPYKSKLFTLPNFLIRPSNASNQEILAGFALTGYFLYRNLAQPRGIELPDSRGRVIGYVSQSA